MKNKTCSIALKNLHDLDKSFSMFVYNNDMAAIKAAGAVDCSYNVLLNKFNPDIETHKPTFSEVLQTSAYTGDLSIFETAASLLGYGIYKIEETKSESSMLHCVFSSIGASANIANLYDKAMADGKVDASERNELIGAVNEAERKLKELRAKLTVKAA
jgi:hypothetical protein